MRPSGHRKEGSEMRCTPDLLERIQAAIEDIEYGTIRVTVNEKGNYTEISVEKKDRVFKESPNYHAG
jgi:hypothetical protein